MTVLVSLILLLNALGQRPAPVPVVDLSPGTARYEGSIRAGEQVTPFSVMRVIEDRGRTWLVTETAEMPSGTSTDQTVLEKGTLLVQSRTVRQGPMAIDLTFTPVRASGTVGGTGAGQTIDVALDGPLFADGAGAYDVLATLSLKPGYSVEYLNLDTRAGKAVRHTLKVLGPEVLVVPAGTFTAAKIELTSEAPGAGVTTLWVASDTHRVLKTATRLPAPRTMEIVTSLLPSK